MAFVEKRAGELVYMSSDLLPCRNVFTTRYGGVSRGELSSLNLLSNRGDSPDNVRENYARLCAVLGVGIDDCAVTNQVHGNDVRTVTEEDRHVCLSPVPYEADGIVTNVRNMPLLCFTADCVPALLCDEANGVIAAVHCGWRSSVTDILGETVMHMTALGARPLSIKAALGPAIGVCCFETGNDVPAMVQRYLSGDTEGLWTQRADGKYLVDLRLANARRLNQLGVPAQNIDISDECTYCLHDKYWSHRYTRGRRGGQASAIVL